METGGGDPVRLGEVPLVRVHPGETDGDSFELMAGGEVTELDFTGQFRKGVAVGREGRGLLVERQRREPWVAIDRSVSALTPDHLDRTGEEDLPGAEVGRGLEHVHVHGHVFIESDFVIPLVGMVGQMDDDIDPLHKLADGRQVEKMGHVNGKDGIGILDTVGGAHVESLTGQLGQDETSQVSGRTGDKYFGRGFGHEGGDFADAWFRCQGSRKANQGAG